MLMDIVLIVIGALVVTYCAIEGFGRAILHLIIFYIMTIILGMVMISVNTMQHLARSIAEMVGGYPNQALFETLLYLVVLIPSTIGIFLLTHYTMDNLNFSRFQWLDTVLSIVTGLILALSIVAILANAWGIIVSAVWRPEQLWLTLRDAYASSYLRPFTARILAVYRSLLFPFRLTRYPNIYTIHY